MGYGSGGRTGGRGHRRGSGGGKKDPQSAWPDGCTAGEGDAQGASRREANPRGIEEVERFCRTTVRSFARGAKGAAEDIDDAEICSRIVEWLQSETMPSEWPPKEPQVKKALISKVLHILKDYFSPDDEAQYHRLETFAPQLLGIWAKEVAGHAAGGGGGRSGRGGQQRGGRDREAAGEPAGGRDRDLDRRGRGRDRTWEVAAGDPEGGDESEGGEEEEESTGGGGIKAPKGKAPPRPTQEQVERLRKAIHAHEETGDPNRMVDILDVVAECHRDGTCPERPLVATVLRLCARSAQFAKVAMVLDMVEAHKVALDVGTVCGIASAVSQRSSTHHVVAFVRRLVESALQHMKPDEVSFVLRHTVFALAELMAEAEESFGRMESKDSSSLAAMGFAEQDLQIDWQNSTAQVLVLYNRAGNNGKPAYQASVPPGFVNKDTAMLSFDVERQDQWDFVPKYYSRIKDGAEVEVVSSQPNAPLVVRLLTQPNVPFVAEGYYRLDKIGKLDQTRRMLEALRQLSQLDAGKGKQNAPRPHPLLHKLLLLPPEVTLKDRGISLEMPLPKRASEVTEEICSRELPRFLNESQLEAVQKAGTQRLTLIQGPPGTGKTTTAVEIVSFLILQEIAEAPMLVTSDSNTAVDNLTRGLASKGLKVVRVGRPESIREDCKQFALDGQWSELKKAEIVCATCIGSGSDILDRFRFHTVLIDECTQATETACLVPICRGTQQLILIGDQCQLKPTVLSEFAQNENLGNSLFNRFCEQGIRPTLLDTQYRMHPNICEFPSAAFYNGRLRTGISHLTRMPPGSFPWPTRSLPVAFINVEKGEEWREGASYTNSHEAEKVIWALQQVMREPQLKVEDVGVVTPYSAQVTLVKKLLRERASCYEFRNVETGSVDGFQGREKEVIIFSAVRANTEGRVGFLSDWRRLNVMLTRARRGLIILGHRKTLNEDPLWKVWLTWAMARGAVLNETAKGTWIPKYLVDDDKWVMRSLDGDAPTAPTAAGPAPAAGAGPGASPPAGAAKPDSWEAVDDWEDLEDKLG